MLLLFIFLILSITFVCCYLFGWQKFSPIYLLLALWSAALSLAQLRLSPLELPLSIKFWLALLLFFGLLIASYFISSLFWQKKIIQQSEINNNQSDLISNLFVGLISMLTLAAILTNLYIYLKLGTLPILSSIPDKMRFIINKEIFGPFEYAALLPRLAIPLAFLYWLRNADRLKKYQKIILLVNIVVGLLILSLYASRLVIVITVLLSYFSYLVTKVEQINFKQIIISSLLAGLIVLSVSTAIPAFRQFITYRDYIYAGSDYNPFTYITSLAQISLPKSLQFIVPVYLIPVFNLQALSRSFDFYNQNHFDGRFELSVFNSLLKIIHLPQFVATINWGKMFVPWWVTATWLFSYFVDFGWLGLGVAAIFWGFGLAGLYWWAVKRPGLISALLLAYFSFVCIMSIYMNYLEREEMYLDLALMAVVAASIFFVNRKPAS